MNDTSGDRKIYEEVLKKAPVALYQVLNALRFHEATKADQEASKRQFASLIKGIYLIHNKEIPEDVDAIFNDIIKAAEGLTMETDEIVEMEIYLKHKKYVKDNDLTWVLTIFREYTEEDAAGDSSNLDDRLDHEFIYLHHHDLKLEFPTEKEKIIAMFVVWLEASYEI